MTLLSACGPQDQAAPDRQTNGSAERRSPALGDAELHGRWAIVTINGVAPLQHGPGRSSAPYLHFDAGGYGGTVGCNHFGGLGLLEAGRYYALPGPQTAMACGPLTAQESEVTRLLAGSPTAAIENGTLRLVSGRRALTLRRSTAPRPEPARRAPAPRLAGTSWNVIAVDGAAVPGSRREVGGRLDFEADSWSAAIGCGRLAGRWRLVHDRILAVGPPLSAPAAACASPDERDALADLGALMRAGPRAVQGANGEMLIAGGGHWASAARRVGGLQDEAALVAGRWRIVGIDGRAPVAGRAAGLAFGPASYTGGTGCNAITGLFIAHERRLFTNPGPQTEQGCAGAVGAQEDRINRLLLASPRIALAGTDSLALIDAHGELRLRREVGAAPSPGAPPVRALGGPVDALLVAIDGEVLQPRYTDPESRLRLMADGRWTAEVRGVALRGVWRRRDGAIAFFTDAPLDDRGLADAELMGLFNGPSRGVIDGNGDLLLAGDAHWLAGRVGRAAR